MSRSKCIDIREINMTEPSTQMFTLSNPQEFVFHNDDLSNETILKKLNILYGNFKIYKFDKENYSKVYFNDPIYFDLDSFLRFVKTIPHKIIYNYNRNLNKYMLNKGEITIDNHVIRFTNKMIQIKSKVYMRSNIPSDYQFNLSNTIYYNFNNIVYIIDVFGVTTIDYSTHKINLKEFRIDGAKTMKVFIDHDLPIIIYFNDNKIVKILVDKDIDLDSFIYEDTFIKFGNNYLNYNDNKLLFSFEMLKATDEVEIEKIK